MSNSEYIKEYQRKYSKRISLCLSKEKDQDIISAIESESNGNLQAGVKSLIRKGIQYNEQEKTFKESFN